MTEPQFLRADVVLPVRDIAESIRWYQAVLGFAVDYLHEGSNADEATNFAILRRDHVQISLILDESNPDYPWTKAGTGYVPISVRSIDELHDAITAQGVRLKRGLQVEDWGVRGFILADPSGNEIRLME